MSDIRNLKQAIMPLIWLNCIFCLGIFEIPVNRPRYFLSAFYVILILTGYFILIYKAIHIFQPIFIQQLKILYVVMGINIIVAVLAIILSWRKSQNLNNIIKRNTIVDSTLEALGIKKEYQKIFHNVLCYMVMWVVGTLTLIIVNAVWIYRIGHWAILYGNICIYFPVMVNSVVDLTFFSLIRCIQMKFQKINNLIENVVPCTNDINVSKIDNWHDNTCNISVTTNYANTKDKIMHYIQTLRHLHLEITRIGWQINHDFCLQIVLELAVHFVVLTATFYCLYDVFFGHLLSEAADKDLILAIAVSACVYSCKIISINWICKSASTEAYKTSEIIQSFEASIVDDDMREEIHQFTQQIMLNSLNFTAVGFFSIDNTLTGKVFATVTTYVVILIQISPSIT